MKLLNVMAAAVVAAGLLPGAPVNAQTTSARFRPLAENLILPQVRPAPMPQPGRVDIARVDATIEALDQASTTTVIVEVKNSSGRRQEAEVIMPLPDGAVVRALTFQGSGKEPTFEILPKDQARSIYESIVARQRDPALLEFIGYNLLRSSVFPVEANATQRIRVTWELLLPVDGDRIDYVLPRTESVEYTIPWSISCTIKATRPISTVYSPTHHMDVARKDPHAVNAQLASDATTVPGPFRLSWLLQRNAEGRAPGVTASLYAYPDAKNGGGYFLLLAGLPPVPETGDAPAIKREVTLVLDRSGSMNGEKIEQVREAARQVLAGLENGELFNIIAYNETVMPFAAQPVIKSDASMKEARAFIDQIQARGGTNIFDALTEALRQKPANGMLPIVLFLTDGLPTVGQTSEVSIRELAVKANPHNRRIFTFGVGVDVNTPLLEKLAGDTRARPTFVLPKEDVEAKVGQVFKGLAGPVLASPDLRIEQRGWTKNPPAIIDVLPAALPDLFEGDQLVVLGRYLGDGPLDFTVKGNYRGQQRAFHFDFPVDKATTQNSFVPRLWASRKIADLIDAIRALGADGQQPRNEPRVKELVDEIVRLSTEFGILTEYTAFLAREGTDLANLEAVRERAVDNFKGRAMDVRSGMGSVSQGYNNLAQREQQVLNRANNYIDENMNRVTITNVQQINDRTFYKRGNRWVDSRLVEKNGEAVPARVIQSGSEEHLRLAEKLAEQGRNGSVSFHGEILLQIEGEAVLVK